jgi:hypothetical protein
MRSLKIFSPHQITRVIKSRIMKWAEHITRMGERNMHRGLWLNSVMKIHNKEDIRLNGKMILKRIKLNPLEWRGLDWSGS